MWIERLTQEVRQCIHCECVVHAGCLVAHFLRREAHNAFVEELLGVIARNCWSCDEAADIRLRTVRSYNMIEQLIPFAHQHAKDDNAPVCIDPDNVKPK
jgi:hypothetical protein